jgi:chromatin remodeling complex protein RSC6
VLCRLTDELASWVGKPTASRPEITKFFWAYCKDNGLQVRGQEKSLLAPSWCQACAEHPPELDGGLFFLLLPPARPVVACSSQDPMPSEGCHRPSPAAVSWAAPLVQDPSDKSFILADDTLKKLTGEERFKGFGFSKLIKEHFTGYA